MIDTSGSSFNIDYCLTTVEQYLKDVHNRFFILSRTKRSPFTD